MAVHAGSHELSASDALRRHDARGGTRGALGPATGRNPCQRGGVHDGSHGDFRSGVKPYTEVLRPGRRLRTAQWACAVFPKQEGEAQSPGDVVGAGGCGGPLPDHLSVISETHHGFSVRYFSFSNAKQSLSGSARRTKRRDRIRDLKTQQLLDPHHSRPDGRRKSGSKVKFQFDWCGFKTHKLNLWLTLYIR